jgi:hypothetical protein
MPTVTLSPVFKQKFFDNSGIPLNGGKLFSYLATTTTKTATYSDAAGSSLNSNPIILNFRGEADVFIEPNKGYKFVLAPSTDTDPPTNPIWSIDNVKNSQLITLYGGIDLGAVNAYVLTFTANFTAYTDGIVIYWIPATTNTGPSTINVNGLGPVSILNQGAAPLLANQIIAGQVITIMYSSGAFLLVSSGIAASVSSGTFVPAWTGYGGVPPTGNMFWQIAGRQAILQWQGTQGTSNANFLTIGNLPTNLRPTTKDLIGAQPTILIDNGAYAAGSFGFGALGVMQFNKGTAPPSGVGFNVAGSKGLPTGWCGTYSLS